MSLNTSNHWVSVIIPCYNAGVYLSDAIESIKKHLSWSIYEIIVSDDWSNDDWVTDNVLDIYDGQKWIKILKHTENKGAQSVRNAGLNNSSFPYVFMLDADDELNNSEEILKKWNYAEKSMNILQNKEVWFVSATTIMFWWFDWYTISPYKLSEDLVVKKHHVPTYMFYRIEDAIQDWIYDESIKKWQDWSAWIWLLNSRLKKWKKNDIDFLNIPYYLYREHFSVSRLSWWKIDEKEMISKTINIYPEIFQKYYPNLNIDEIVNQVFLSKPSKIKDLFYIAYLNNIKLARKIVKERWWFISWKLFNLDQLLLIASEKWVEFVMKIVEENNIELLHSSELWNIP